MAEAVRIARERFKTANSSANDERRPTNPAPTAPTVAGGGPHSPAAAVAIFSLAMFKFHGRGGPQDSGAAKAYYERAAALGNEDAKAALKRSDCGIVIKDKRGKQVGTLCW